MTTSTCQPLKEHKPCNKHGIVERNANGRCKQCKAEHDKKYRKENKDYIFFAKKEYREKNKEEIKKRKRLYYENNLEKVNISSVKWRNENPELAKLAFKKWCAENKEKKREYSRNWSRNNRKKEYEKSKRLRLSDTEKYNKKQRDYYQNNIYCLKNVKTHLKSMAIVKGIKLSGKDIPGEIVELKRLQMKLYHAIKAREQQQTGERK